MERKTSVLKQDDQMVVTRSVKEGEVRVNSSQIFRTTARTSLGEASYLDQGLEKGRTPNTLLQHLLPLLSSRSLTWMYPKQETKSGISVLPCESLKGFVSSSANVVLLRLMALRQAVPSGARFLVLDSEGSLCYCTYVSTVSGHRN